METDIKKIVALSTLRQLGLIFFSLGLGSASLTFFHLISHAFTKAFLFIIVGYFIHVASDFQDMRKLGVLSRGGPKLGFFFTVACFTLCGYPFMVLYYSKEIIVESLMAGGVPGTGWASLLLVSLTLTTTYSTRLFITIFTSVRRGSVSFIPHEKSQRAKSVRQRTLYFFITINFFSLLTLMGQEIQPLPVTSPYEIKTLVLFIIGLGGLGGALVWKIFVINRNQAWSWGSIWGLISVFRYFPQKIRTGLSPIFRENIDLTFYGGAVPGLYQIPESNFMV